VPASGVTINGGDLGWQGALVAVRPWGARGEPDEENLGFRRHVASFATIGRSTPNSGTHHPSGVTALWFPATCRTGPRVQFIRPSPSSSEPPARDLREGESAACGDNQALVFRPRCPHEPRSCKRLSATAGVGWPRAEVKEKAPAWRRRSFGVRCRLRNPCACRIRDGGPRIGLAIIGSGSHQLIVGESHRRRVLGRPQTCREAACVAVEPVRGLAVDGVVCTRSEELGAGRAGRVEG
jgi:hypothetical protein